MTLGKFRLLPNPENGLVWFGLSLTKMESYLAIAMIHEMNMRDVGTGDLSNTSYNWNWIVL